MKMKASNPSNFGRALPWARPWGCISGWGLAETFAGVVLVHLAACLPYAVFVMWDVFSNYDPEFECGLTVGYGGTPVVRDFDLTMADGEVVSLLGPSGAGKTTLLRAVAGLTRPMAG